MCENLNIIDNDKFADEVMGIIIAFLQKKKLKLSNLSIDGRLNSVKNEEEVVDALNSLGAASEWMCKNKIIITCPNKTNNREWYDFAIEGTGTDREVFIPVNIKVSEMTSADNLNCKLGIFYALTGIIPQSQNLNNGCGWDKYFQKLDENMATSKNKDYYFLVVNKLDSSDVFYTTLKSIKSLVPNGNNLPFQCKWSDNRVLIKRNYEDSRNFLLCAFRASINRMQVPAAFARYAEKYITKEISEHEIKKGCF